MAEEEKSVESLEGEEGQAQGQSVEAHPNRRETSWKPGQSGNPSGKPKAEAHPLLGRPQKPALLVDLEWAYKNVETKVKPKNAQQELFRGDFTADREKTLKLLAQLQKEYRDRVKAWMDAQKAVAGTLGLVGGVGKSGLSGVSGVGGVLAADEGEERVRDMMKRLLEEASNGGGDSSVSGVQAADVSKA